MNNLTIARKCNFRLQSCTYYIAQYYLILNTLHSFNNCLCYKYVTRTKANKLMMFQAQNNNIQNVFLCSRYNMNTYYLTRVTLRSTNEETGGVRTINIYHCAIWNKNQLFNALKLYISCYISLSSCFILLM